MFRKSSNLAREGDSKGVVGEKYGKLDRARLLSTVNGMVKSLGVVR